MWAENEENMEAEEGDTKLRGKMTDLQHCSLSPHIVTAPHPSCPLLSGPDKLPHDHLLLWPQPLCSQHLLSSGDGEGQVGHSSFSEGKLLREVRLPSFPSQTFGSGPQVSSRTSTQCSVFGSRLRGLQVPTVPLPSLPRQPSFSLSPSPSCLEPPSVAPNPLPGLCGLTRLLTIRPPPMKPAMSQTCKLICS